MSDLPQLETRVQEQREWPPQQLLVPPTRGTPQLPLPQPPPPGTAQTVAQGLAH